MVKEICLDTDIIIELLEDNKQIKEKITMLDATFFTTIINLFELWSGKKDKRTIYELLQRLKVINLDKQSAFIAGTIRRKLEDKGEVVDFRDVFVASICINSNLELLTNNKKHFERIKKHGLMLVE